MITDWIKNLINSAGQLIWIIIIAVAVLVGMATIALSAESGSEAQVIQLTLDAVSTQSNEYVPTLSANLTLTPVDAALTGAAPTLSLAGKQEVQMYAASASASSERGPLNQGAVQAVGPPNTPECGDYLTAWASATPTGTASLTLLFPELVTPTAILVHETYNPGFIIRIEFTDIYGEIHTVYEAAPQPRGRCPFTLLTLIEDAEYKGNRVTIYVDQRTSTGGWNQIDAVQLIGIRH